MIHFRDCLEGIKELDDESVDAVVTSPPYNLNIKYSKYKDKKPREQYLKWIEDIFIECKRVLKDDGHLFVNMGYSNVDPWIGMEVAFAIRNSMHLQNHINWVKSIAVHNKQNKSFTTYGHFKPIPGERFLCPTWEHLFHFTKDGNVKLDRLSIGVEYEYYEENLRHSKSLDFTDSKENKRDKGNCWFIPYETVNSKELRGKHPATFPVKLVEDCIRLTNIDKGVVLDPFMGTGTTGVAAVNLGWDYIGYEIDEDYVTFSTQRINNPLDMFYK